MTPWNWLYALGLLAVLVWICARGAVRVNNDVKRDAALMRRSAERAERGEQ